MNEIYLGGLKGVKLNSPIMNAAGCYCSNYEQMNVLARTSGIGAIVSKSSTLLPRNGNSRPNVYIDNNISVNSIGLANAGIEYYSKYDPPDHDIPCIQSVFVDSTNIINTLEFINKLPSRRNFEFNISCPNMGVGASEDEFPTLIGLIKDEISEKHIWGLKMPVLFRERDFDFMSTILQINTPNFITTSNTIPHGLTLTTRGSPRISAGFGGVGGIKPLGLANTYEFYRRLPGLSIIGCGGIRTADDVIEYIRCGATCVQIGTALLQYGPQLITQINNTLASINLSLIRGTFRAPKL